MLLLYCRLREQIFEKQSVNNTIGIKGIRELVEQDR